MPVRDEELTIDQLIEGLLNQTLPPDEIVITDGGSIDATREKIEEFVRRGAPIKLICDQNSLPGRCRNLAIANARNNWIAFIDAGITPEPTWLADLAEKVTNGANVDVVYGSYEPVIDSFFRECAAISYVPSPVRTEEGPVRPHSIASALMRREAWRRVGGFPESLRSAEDLVFMNKVEDGGYRIVRAPRAVVYWTIQPSLWRTFRRFVVYARHNIRAGLWHRWQATIFRRYALIAATAVPALFVGARWLIVPVVLWLSFLTLRSVRVLRKNQYSYPAGNWRNLFRLLMIIPIMATLDAAAFVGTISWFFFDKLFAVRTAISI